MKILIDHSNLIVGGGIQVGSSFLNDLRSLSLDNEYFVIQSFNSKNSIEKRIFPQNFIFFDLNELSLKSIKKRSKEVFDIENRIKPDVIFTTFGPSYHKSSFPKIVGFAIPYLIYPNSPFFKLIPFLERLQYKILGVIKKRAFIKNSNALIFESINAESIIAKKLPNNIKTFTVNNTLNEIFLDKNRWEPLDYLLPKSFNILCLTAYYKHKNIGIVPKVIEVLEKKYNFSDFKFIITISKNELNFDSKFDKNIEYLGKVSLNQIPELYQKSTISFMPTLLEVFSATYLEAMYMEKPIITSDLAFSKEICGDAALFCNPLEAEKYADAIFELYTNESLRKELINKGKDNLKRFGTSLDRTKKYLDIMEKIKSYNHTII
ncbi:glycosyltransferase [Pedobacter nototheniae]|uniref:glycosyltransferase n=1 Tax=Pedobacter nototheniae TaxID=2488994 RepID=UPI00292DF477|nr:glycosyltransferase [Pedobacter nototheniae]